MIAALEDYALIGDGVSSALVSRDGSLDWLCWPRFDSAACFARLLGTEEHGCWTIAPAVAFTHRTRRYAPDTLILESEWHCAGGALRLVDFMPVGAGASSVVRLLIGLTGRVPVHTTLVPRFDYGSIAPWVEAIPGGARLRAGADVLTLSAPVPLTLDGGGCHAQLTLAAGERRAFVLTYGAAGAPLPPQPDVERSLERTARDWRDWIARFDRSTPWPDAVRRSLLTLRALIYRPSGGIIAAPTTSLPEQFGGSLNWDYRFCWLRDSTFTLTALLNAGYREEASAWRDWILAALAGEPAKMRTMYRVDGARDVSERAIHWLPGYCGSVPVRIGNLAAYQHQGDIYGEVIDSMELATRAGVPQSPHGQQVERAIAEYLEHAWNVAGQGLWESRGEPRHYTYARVMAWVGVDRFLASSARYGHADPQLTARLQALRTQIREDVLRHGYDPARGRFVQRYGGVDVDASLLLLPLVGFIGVDDPRMAATIAAIERELVQDGLVQRQASRHHGRQTAFLACSCWLADCRRLQGRDGEARAALERVLSVRNDLGLLSEEYSIADHRLCGNFPQALSHLALVNSALAMSGPVLQRGGG